MQHEICTCSKVTQFHQLGAPRWHHNLVFFIPKIRSMPTNVLLLNSVIGFINRLSQILVCLEPAQVVSLIIGEDPSWQLGTLELVEKECRASGSWLLLQWVVPPRNSLIGGRITLPVVSSSTQAYGRSTRALTCSYPHTTYLTLILDMTHRVLQFRDGLGFESQHWTITTNHGSFFNIVAHFHFKEKVKW